jgi:hypothetical protein
MIGIVIAIALLVVLSQKGGGLLGGDTEQRQGALSTVERPPIGQPAPHAPALKDRVHAIEDKVLGAGAGVVGGAACAYYGAAVVAPVCAKVATYLEKPARKLANYTTLKATDAGGYLLRKQAAGLKAVTTGIGANAAGRVNRYVDTAYDVVGHAPGPLSVIGKASIAPIKVAAAIGSKGASLADKAAGGVVSGVKAGTNAVSSVAHTVIGWL